ncbi:uncharacterized protein LOC116265904 isoform X2 [Nymphaea colorata]|uniref:uncharacterized protein LOC116265904 isoform X2 n=1 Tax=Nymphaea colorata TaxID=210225 RepID=UPI00129DADD6|nr:uncharacterized protein LOC116265904 isoform X2 [Nymphaea colorata]
MASNIPVSEVYWSLVDKADKKFIRVRELPSYGKNRYDSYFHKVFKVYTQLWKFQQENRQKLVEAGLKRWEIGEIAYRIAQLYYSQYMRTSELNYLTESYIFYEAIFDREYFKENPQNLGLVNKQLRCLGRFLVVCLLLNRREKVQQLINDFRILLEESRRMFQETDFKEWKHVLHEMVRFIRVDSDFMNIRPLRYSLVLDAHFESIPHVSSENKRALHLRSAILCSYQHNEVKFTEITLDTFRMLQCLEWEPSGSFYRVRDSEVSKNGKEEGLAGGTASTRVMHLEDITDPSLPPNPQKTILYRPSATHFLAVLATLCEEMPFDGILLIYLSGKGDQDIPSVSVPGDKLEPVEHGSGYLQGHEMMYDSTALSPVHSLNDSPTLKINQPDSCESYLQLGCHGGVNGLYACDLIPFSRRPLFLVIDSNCSQSFKDISGTEKGDRAALLLSPASPSPASGATEKVRYSSGSQFTMFLTAPLQAFCQLVGLSGSKLVDMHNYHGADKLLSTCLAEWGSSLAADDSLDPVWIRVFDDPFLRRLILRFIFCRAVLSLYAPTFSQKEFVPECLPPLPNSFLPINPRLQSAILGIANVLGVASHFVFSDGILQQSCIESVLTELKVSDVQQVNGDGNDSSPPGEGSR